MRRESLNTIEIRAPVIHMAEVEPNGIYMTVSMRMFSTRPNVNGIAVTEAFIDHIVANAAKYVCIPLCADTTQLRHGRVDGLGHM